MKIFKIAVLGLALGSAGSMADDCVAPAQPEVPEGEDSSMEQMLAGQKAVKEFQEANLAYMSCLEPLLAAAEAEAAAALKEGAEGATDKYTKIQEAYNAAVFVEEEVAAKFNTEIRDYKTANPS